MKTNKKIPLQQQPPERASREELSCFGLQAMKSIKQIKFNFYRIYLLNFRLIWFILNRFLFVYEGSHVTLFRFIRMV